MSKISMDKKYKTRDGRPVRILCVDRKDREYPVVALVQEREDYESVQSFTGKGNFMIHYDGDNYDLIEVLPYEDFKIDEPVMVRAGVDGHWYRRHFAGVDTYGSPMAWDCGVTSFTSGNSRACAWHECRRPTPEELAGK